MYEIVFMKKAQKDLKLLHQKPAMMKNVFALVELIKRDPYQNPPPFEELMGDLAGVFSRRLNRKDRIVYTIDDECKIIYVHRVRGHYE